MKGKVFLVGAGPGDPGLLTLRGRELIRQAEVVVYDRLVSRDVMEMVPEKTRRIDVGKNAGNHPVPQQAINEILVEQARAGRMVVRLKGGDPFVFGRGGEELEALVEAGIDFEVVPGITSSIAAPVYGGIPLTHRDYCSSLHIITGHQRGGKELGLDFEALTRLGGTLVFLMSVSNIGEIAQGLLQAGMDPQMPCAVVERGTLPGQRRVMGVLETIEAVVRNQRVRPPAVILVGRVCALADRFAWFEKRPLLGKRILVTQPRKKGSVLAEKLRQMGAEVILYPCMHTEPIRPLAIPEGLPAQGTAGGEAGKRASDPSNSSDGPVQPAQLAGNEAAAAPATGLINDATASVSGLTTAAASATKPFDTLVFTSGEGVRSYCDWLLEQGQDMRALAGMRIACIGSATAAALGEYGLLADFIPSVYSGQALGREMIERGFVDRHSRVLLLRTRMASRDVTDALEAAKIPFADIPVYETSLVDQPPLAQIEGEKPVDLITFTSRSCVEGFLRSQRSSAEEAAPEDKRALGNGPRKAPAGSNRDGRRGSGEAAFAGRKALCIGPRTAAAAEKAGFEVIVSAEATIENMLETARRLASETTMVQYMVKKRCNRSGS